MTAKFSSDKQPALPPAEISPPSAARSRVPRYRRLENYPQVTLNAPRQKILPAIGRFVYLSAPQLTRLLFSPKSLTYVRQQLMELYQGGYVDRLYNPTPTPEGSRLAMYRLDTKGAAYLRRSGMPEVKAGSEVGGEFLKHVQESNDLMITFHLIPKADPQSEVVTCLTELELRRRPAWTRIARQRTKVIPDGWVHLRRKWPDQEADHYILFELDRGTEEQYAFREKIRSLAHLVNDGYEQRFGVRGLTIAVVNTHSPKKLQDLIRWTQDELKQQHLEELAELFLFANLDPAEADPLDFAFKLFWRQPFSEQRVPLLESPTPEEMS